MTLFKAIRTFPAQPDRVETGAIQFGEDWPGTFIRGDDAAGAAMLLKQLLKTGELRGGDRLFLDIFIEALESSNLKNRPHES